MNNDCAEVDKLILEIADYKNDYADVAAEKTFEEVLNQLGRLQYLRDRVHDTWLPNGALQQFRGLMHA